VNRRVGARWDPPGGPWPLPRQGPARATMVRTDYVPAFPPNRPMARLAPGIPLPRREQHFNGITVQFVEVRWLRRFSGPPPAVLPLLHGLPGARFTTWRKGDAGVGRPGGLITIIRPLYQPQLRWSPHHRLGRLLLTRSPKTHPDSLPAFPNWCGTPNRARPIAPGAYARGDKFRGADAVPLAPVRILVAPLNPPGPTAFTLGELIEPFARSFWGSRPEPAVPTKTPPPVRGAAAPRPRRMDDIPTQDFAKARITRPRKY